MGCLNRDIPGFPIDKYRRYWSSRCHILIIPGIRFVGYTVPNHPKLTISTTSAIAVLRKDRKPPMYISLSPKYMQYNTSCILAWLLIYERLVDSVVHSTWYLTPHCLLYEYIAEYEDTHKPHHSTRNIPRPKAWIMKHGTFLSHSKPHCNLLCG